MKATIVARYARLVASLPIVSALSRPAFEHLEHPVGDDEASDDVCGCEYDGHETDDPRQRVLVVEASDEHRTDDHDSVDRVRSGHERRVQERRHLRDHLEAEEDREREDRDLEDEQRSVTHRAMGRTASRLPPPWVGFGVPPPSRPTLPHEPLRVCVSSVPIRRTRVHPLLTPPAPPPCA